VKYVFDAHMSKASKRLTVVLLHLWRVNVQTTGGFICIHRGIFIQINSRHNNLTTLNVGRHSLNNFPCRNPYMLHFLHKSAFIFISTLAKVYVLNALHASGYVRARCVEDYTQITRRSSEDGTLSVSSSREAVDNTETRRKTSPPAAETGQTVKPPAEAGRKVSPPLSWEKPLEEQNKPAKKVISFSDITEEDDEEEEEEEEINAAELYKNLGKRESAILTGG
jgi:hypothetical protein